MLWLEVTCGAANPGCRGLSRRRFGGLQSPLGRLSSLPAGFEPAPSGIGLLQTLLHQNGKDYGFSLNNASPVLSRHPKDLDHK